MSKNRPFTVDDNLEAYFMHREGHSYKEIGEYFQVKTKRTVAPTIMVASGRFFWATHQFEIKGKVSSPCQRTQCMCNYKGECSRECQRRV